MSERYFYSKLDTDDRKALSGLKKSQPSANWSAEKYCKLNYTEVYDAYKSKATDKAEEIYLDFMSPVDKAALKGLKAASPGTNWSPESFTKLNYPEEYNVLKAKADKEASSQGKYRDLIFWDYLDSEDREILKRLKQTDPGVTAENLMKQSNRATYDALLQTMESYNSGDLYFEEEPEEEEFFPNGNDEEAYTEETQEPDGTEEQEDTEE